MIPVAESEPAFDDRPAALPARSDPPRRGREPDSAPSARGGAAEPRAAAGRAVAIRFASDGRGRIVRADRAVAPMLIEMPLGREGPLAPARCDAATARAIRERRPVANGRIAIDGSPVVAGEWQIDAAPQFEPASGTFVGYRGVLRRAAPADDDTDDAIDGLRQLLHELRTPIGAIQGFAELIQQQLFGPAPPRIRDLAAEIAAESAAVLAALAGIERESAEPGAGRARQR